MSGLQASDLTLDVPNRRLLREVQLSVPSGWCVAVMGPSGSGKTSLFNCLAGIVRPSSGTISVAGVNITDLNAAGRSALRLRRIGMVFQFGELLPELSVLENVALPLRLMGVDRGRAHERARRCLQTIGLNELLESFPSTLSGGETQRAALARALVHEPALILADEPTGALDEDNSVLVGDLLVDAAKTLNAVVLIATHDPCVAAKADVIYRLRAGRLEAIAVPQPEEPEMPT